MIEVLFAKIFQLSLIGCYSIIVALFARPLLARCGRRYAYYLWLIVFFNLCMPISFQGIFSLIPRQVAEFSLESKHQEKRENTVIYLPAQIEDDRWEQSKLEEVQGQKLLEESRKELIEQQIEDTEHWKVQEFLRQCFDKGWIIWILGVILLLIWNVIEAFLLNRRLFYAAQISGNKYGQIVEIEGLPTPFLWGILHPIIYLPKGLKGEEREYILLHENYHQKRLDYLVKPLILLVMILHWFNPLVWLAYNLCCKDMEMSCDEAVLARSHKQVRKAYAKSILKYAAKQNGYLISPLTFGEPSTKARIQHVLQYKKKHMFFSVLAMIGIGVLSAGLLIRPLKAAERTKTSVSDEPQLAQDILIEENVTSIPLEDEMIIEERPWEREQIVGVPCKPKESGWKLENVIDLSNAEKFRNYFTKLYKENKDHTEETYLLGQTEHFTLYGSGDEKTMLLERNQFYAQINYPYVSKYITPLMLLEKDFDKDGIEELAILFNIKHGSSMSVDTLLIADLETGSGWFVTQLMESEIIEALIPRLSFERSEHGLQPYVNGEKAGSLMEDIEGFDPWQEVKVGEIIEIFYGEDGDIRLKAELGFSHNQYLASPTYNGTYMTAKIVWNNKRFRLKNIAWEE